MVKMAGYISGDETLNMARKPVIRSVKVYLFMLHFLYGFVKPDQTLIHFQ